MTTVDFTSSPDIPMTSAFLSCGDFDDGRDRLLDTDVDHFVPVVRQDDVDEVLADVVHIALDRREDDPALAVFPGRLHVRFEVCHSGFHDLGGLEHERQLHLSGPEQLADGLHAGQQGHVDDLERRLLLSSPHRGRSRGRRARRRRCDARVVRTAAACRVPGHGSRGPTPPTRPRTAPSASAAGRIPRGDGRRPDRARPRRCSSGIFDIGRIFDACTIAVSRPACTHSCRNTELSTWRAAGFSPNEMLEIPRVKCTSGWFSLRMRMASMVSMPSLRTSS